MKFEVIIHRSHILMKFLFRKHNLERSLLFPNEDIHTYSPENYRQCLLLKLMEEFLSILYNGSPSIYWNSLVQSHCSFVL